MHKIHESLLDLAVQLDVLTPDPENARVHTDRNLDSIAASLRAYGQRKPVVVQKREDEFVVRAGNGTVEAARRLGWDEIAAVVMDEDDVTAAAYGLADNRTAELASWDEGMLAKLLGRISSEADDYDPMNMGFEEREVIKLLAEFGDLSGGLADLDLSDLDDIDDTDKSAQTSGLGGDASDAEGEHAELPTSHVRMVQLFLNEDNHAEFMDSVRKLAAKYGTSNVTDTVFKAVEDAAAG
jgi:ParB-like chromosome segregation protein Spo0J